MFFKKSGQDDCAKAVIVTPQTFVVSKGGKGGQFSAFACLHKPDSVVVEIVTPTAKGPRVVLAHLDEDALEFPTTLALLKAAELSTNSQSANPFCRVYACNKGCGRAVMAALRRETGLRIIRYKAFKRKQGVWVGLDLNTGIHKQWRDVADRALVRALMPPVVFGQRLKAFGYWLRNHPLLRWAQNPLYVAQFPEQGQRRKARRYDLKQIFR